VNNELVKCGNSWGKECEDIDVIPGKVGYPELPIFRAAYFICLTNVRTIDIDNKMTLHRRGSRHINPYLEVAFKKAVLRELLREKEWISLPLVEEPVLPLFVDGDFNFLEIGNRIYVEDLV
jgi:hypothetical protein